MSPNDGLPTGSTAVERPAPGLARGKVAAPAWVVAALGASIVIAAITYAAVRILRSVKR